MALEGERIGRGSLESAEIAKPARRRLYFINKFHKRENGTAGSDFSEDTGDEDEDAENDEDTLAAYRRVLNAAHP